MVKINKIGVGKDGHSIRVDVDGNVNNVYILTEEQYKGLDTVDTDNLYSGGPYESGRADITLTEEEIRAEHKEFDGFERHLMIIVIKAEDETVVKAAFHGEPIYKSLMEAAVELDATCRPPVWFIDKFLRFKAVEAALEAGDVTMAAKYWSEFMTHGESPMRGRGRGGCGCHA